MAEITALCLVRRIIKEVGVRGGSWVKILFEPVLQYVVALLFYFPKWYHLSFNPTGFDFMAQNVTHGIPILVEFYIGKCRQICQKVRQFFNL